MIVTKTPFRISFAGGGSDISSFYKYHDGAVISATINKYSFIVLHELFEGNKKYCLKYTTTEFANNLEEISHPIFRAALSNYSLNKNIEITSVADIPSGTGLASSSAFSASLLSALNYFTNNNKSKSQLANDVCNLEINQLSEPIGKQDQYSCVFGGLNFFKFKSNGSVVRKKLSISDYSIKILEKNILLFYTGMQRKTSLLLKKQNENISSRGNEFKNMIKLVDLAYKMKENLLNSNFDDFGLNLNKSWELKKSFNESITNKNIDEYYSLALQNGALGGKITGAGGGGFLMLYCPEKNQNNLRKALFNLTELKFQFEPDGTQIIFKENI